MSKFNIFTIDLQFTCYFVDNCCDRRRRTFVKTPSKNCTFLKRMASLTRNVKATHFKKGLPLLGSIKTSFGDFGHLGIFICAATRGVFQDLLLVAKLKSCKI